MKLLPYPPAPTRYLVSDEGSVFGLMNNYSNPLKEPRKLSPYKCKSGYLHICLRLSKGEQSKRIGIHSIVCTTFHGPKPSSEYQVGHRDGDSTNNRPDNLRWVTAKENAADRDSHGKTVWGERSTRGKLTADVAQAVRVLSKNGFTLEQMAIMFGVSPPAIHGIVSGKNWKRLTPL